MMNRRSFLRTTAGAAGAALCLPVALAEAKYMMHRRNPLRVSAVDGGLTYPILEADADADNYVCEWLGGVGANETGEGLGLAGANLVLTNLDSAGASVGGWRPLIDSDRFSGTASLSNLGTVWGMLLQVRNLVVPGTANSRMINVPIGPPNWALYQQSNGKFEMLFADGVFTGNVTTTNSYPTDSDTLWVYIGADGVNAIRMGFKKGAQPTKWNDFPVGSRIENTGGDGDMTGATGLLYIAGRQVDDRSVTYDIKSLTISNLALPDT